jgi:nucleoid-associated protein YgaU
VSQERVTPLSPAAQPKLPDHYRVWIWQENGDCLWRIAEKVYGDRTKWNLIYMANRDVIKDPNKIYPKQRLRIPPPDWQP